MPPQIQSMVRVFLGVLFLGSLAACTTQQTRPPPGTTVGTKALLGTRATYCSVPRKKDGRMDADKLVAELVDLHANTYSFCIHSAATDWDDFKLFLPVARAKGIRVWASLVPPSESPPRTK